MVQGEHEAIRRTKGNKDSLSWDDYKSMSFTKNVSSNINLIHRFMSAFCQTLMATTSCPKTYVIFYFSQVIKEMLRLGNGRVGNVLMRRTVENVEMQGIQYCYSLSQKVAAF